MNWSMMTPREKSEFLRGIEGRIVFAHSQSFRIWGAAHLFGPCLEISVGCLQAGMDSSGSAMVFVNIEDIKNVKRENGGPSYIITCV